LIRWAVFGAQGIHGCACDKMWTVGYENGLHMDKFVMGQEQVLDFFQMVLERKSQITKSGAMTIVPTCR